MQINGVNCSFFYHFIVISIGGEACYRTSINHSGFCVFSIIALTNAEKTMLYSSKRERR